MWKRLRAEGETEIDIEDVKEFLDEMVELKLMYEEDGYLSLAVAANPQTRSAFVDAEDSFVASPAMVKLSRQGVAL